VKLTGFAVEVGGSAAQVLVMIVHVECVQVSCLPNVSKEEIMIPSDHGQEHWFSQTNFPFLVGVISWLDISDE
jgi:hypothetical protein